MGSGFVIYPDPLYFKQTIKNLKQIAFIILILHSILSFGQEKVLDLRTDWKFRLGDRSSWASVDLDDSNWEEINVPSNWEDEGFHGYDGYAWYRISFDGRDLPKNKTLYLHLGYIDDVDEAYFNGELIGFTGYFPPHFKTAYKAKREYLIPAEYINFEGKNTIAVRIFDTVHEGGITRGNVGIYTINPDARMLIDLMGLWHFKTGRSAMKNQNFETWKQIMAAIPWESQGFNRYDGYAWYRKSFYVPKEISDDELVLILGKIDDFDETYLNEEIIGETNDGRGYGISMSFNKLRVYDIPEGLLKKGEMNEIRIFVEDMGNTGGMWEGPVGITTRDKYYRYFRFR